jgi:hypothetical protein
MRGKVAKAALTIALLVLPAMASAQGRPAIVIVKGAGLYELPAKSLGMKVEVAPKTLVRVLDQQGSWYVVRAADLVGWMQKYTLLLTGTGSSSTRTSIETSPSKPRSVASGRSYTRSPNGGCFYYSQAGRKVYVDRNACS